MQQKTSPTMTSIWFRFRRRACGPRVLAVGHFNGVTGTAVYDCRGQPTSVAHNAEGLGLAGLNQPSPTGMVLRYDAVLGEKTSELNYGRMFWRRHAEQHRACYRHGCAAALGTSFNRAEWLRSSNSARCPTRMTWLMCSSTQCVGTVRRAATPFPPSTVRCNLSHKNARGQRGMVWRGGAGSERQGMPTQCAWSRTCSRRACIAKRSRGCHRPGKPSAMQSNSGQPANYSFIGRDVFAELGSSSQYRVAGPQTQVGGHLLRVGGSARRLSSCRRRCAPQYSESTDSPHHRRFAYPDTRL